MGGIRVSQWESEPFLTLSAPKEEGEEEEEKEEDSLLTLRHVRPRV